jgi:hypothetical protein
MSVSHSGAREKNVSNIACFCAYGNQCFRCSNLILKAIFKEYKTDLQFLYMGVK